MRGQSFSLLVSAFVVSLVGCFALSIATPSVAFAQSTDDYQGLRDPDDQGLRDPDDPDDQGLRDPDDPDDHGLRDPDDPDDQGLRDPDDPDGDPDGEVVFWNVRSTNEDARSEFSESVGSALADERGTHLLTDEDFEAWVARRPGAIPACFKGLEPCISARAMAFEALGLSLIVEVELDSSDDGPGATWSAQDARGEVVEEGEARGTSMREVAFSVVARLFDATGAMRFESEPKGARLWINAIEVGTTPHLVRLPVGRHEFTMALDDFETETGSLEITRSQSSNIRRTLRPSRAILIVQDAPAGAAVFVNDKRMGLTGEPIEFEPGNHVFEVRADGYTSRHDTVDLKPGEERVKSASLEVANPFLRSFGSDAIARFPYSIRLSFEHGFQSTKLRDARTTNPDFEFVGFDADAESRSKTVHGNGLRVDLGYSFENFGLSVLSATYYVGSVGDQVLVETPDGDATGRLAGLHRLQLRPFQISYRHFIDRFVPFAEFGTGIDFQWLSIEGESFDDVTLTQTNALVALAVGANYYVTPQLFATVRYGLQGYFVSDSGADHLFSIGAGMSFDNLFGLDAEPPGSL